MFGMRPEVDDQFTSSSLSYYSVNIAVLVLCCCLCYAAACVLLLDGVDGRVHDSVSYCCKSI